MKKERMKVLDMVENGKISVDEAAKLLEALKLSGTDDILFECDEAEENLNKFSQSVDAFAKDFSDKMGGLIKDVEPKFKSATKTVIEKTVSVIDDISKTLNESLKNMEDSAKKECAKEECTKEACKQEDCKQEDCTGECTGNGPAPDEKSE